MQKCLNAENSISTGVALCYSDSNSSTEKIPTTWSGFIKSHNKFLDAFLCVSFNDNNTS